MQAKLDPKVIYGATREKRSENLVNENLEYNKVPFDLIKEALWFFRMIYQEKKTEVGVIITKDQSGKYRLEVPKQNVSGGSVKWENHGEIQNVVGSIHSHCNFGGSFSSTDLEDNRKNIGLHIVIGDILSTPSFDVELSISNLDVRRPNIKEVVQDFTERKNELPSPLVTTQALNRIDKSFYGNTTYGNTDYGYGNTYPYNKGEKFNHKKGVWE